MAIGKSREGVMGSIVRYQLTRAAVDESTKVRAAAEEALLMDDWLELID